MLDYIFNFFSYFISLVAINQGEKENFPVDRIYYAKNSQSRITSEKYAYMSERIYNEPEFPSRGKNNVINISAVI